MKIFEITGPDTDFGGNRERGYELHWGREQAEKHNAMQLPAKGIWIISPAGKKLAGPFKSGTDAQTFANGRPDRVGKGYRFKEL